MSIERLCSSFSTPDSETIANSLVLVGHGIQGDLDRLKEMSISKSFYSVFYSLPLGEYVLLFSCYIFFSIPPGT